MINNISNSKNINFNNYYGIKNINTNTNVSNIINIAKYSYRNKTYALYDNKNALFINNYTSSLKNLKELNSKLTGDNKKNVLNSLTLSSSNEKVLIAKSFFTPKNKTSYEVNVTQIAKAQVNTSKGLTSNNISTMGLSTINIANKSKNYSFTVDTSIKTNNEVFADIATKINKSNIGVFATVKKDKDKSILEITSDNTGKKENFTISGSDEFMLQTNLSSVTQTSQDAVFDVSKNGNTIAVNKTSSTNDVDIDGYNVSATLKDVGKANISLDVDKKKIAESLNNFVSAYNSTISFLSNNIYKGSGISKQLSKLQVPKIYEKSLATLGITQGTDGKLEIDDKALNEVLTDNISLVENELKSKYSVFSTIDKNINSALKESSVNLIDNTLKGIQAFNDTGEFSINDSFLNKINLLSTYNNSGYFGMINYSAIGLFINTFM